MHAPPSIFPGRNGAAEPFLKHLTPRRDAIYDSVSAQNSRLPGIDGLRGGAIWMVLIGHFFVGLYADAIRLTSPTASALCSRYLWGVDLFFVISGFLIGGILIDHRHSVRLIKAFYIRRALRIWPLYFFVVLVLIGPAYSLGFPAQQRYMPYWSYLVFAQNIWMANGFWGLLAFGPLWSIAVEEQFYLIAPLLARSASFTRMYLLVAATIILAVLARLACVYWPSQNGNLATLCRLDAIAAGILGALLLRNEWTAANLATRIRLKWVVALMVLPLFAIAGWSGSPVLIRVVAPLYVAFFFLAVLLLSVQNTAGWIARLLQTPFLVTSGKYCYFLYLFHLTLLYNVELLIDEPLVARFVSLALCFASASISWRFIESPIILFGKRWKYSEDA